MAASLAMRSQGTRLRAEDDARTFLQRSSAFQLPSRIRASSRAMALNTAWRSPGINESVRGLWIRAVWLAGRVESPRLVLSVGLATLIFGLLRGALVDFSLLATHAPLRQALRASLAYTSATSACGRRRSCPTPPARGFLTDTPGKWSA